MEQVAKLAGRANQIKVAGPLMRRLQDLVVPFALKHFVHPETETWVYQYAINWDAQIEGSLTAQNQEG